MKDYDYFDLCEYITIDKNIGENVYPEHKCRILIPINDVAVDRLYVYDIYDNGKIRSDMICLEFDENTYLYMESKFFFRFNDEFGTYISMYEEEIIGNENLDKAMLIVSDLIRECEDAAIIVFGQKLLRLIEFAKDCGTVVGFYF